MLVLSRKLGECVVVPALGLRITVVRITGNKVRLGIAGPGDVAVHREEVWQQICATDAGPKEPKCAGVR